MFLFKVFAFFTVNVVYEFIVVLLFSLYFFVPFTVEVSCIIKMTLSKVTF